MSLKANLILDDQVFEGCIFRVQRVSSVNAEFEFFENVNDPEHPEIAQKVSWTNKFENIALVYVWPDEIARNNRAQTIHTFTFEFEWNPDVYSNPFKLAYQKLKELYPEGIDI